MLTDDQIRDLLEKAEDAFQKIGPTYALTELLLAMRATLPTPIEELPVRDENERVWTDEEIIAHQNEILRDFPPLNSPTRPAVLRPSHL